MRVLVACEYSGIVREAFKERGHYAWSCDLLPTEVKSNRHYQGDIFDFIDMQPTWDLLVAHPPCTYLANSGVQYLHKDPSRWESMRGGDVL